MSKVKIGIIGGSGLDNPALLENRLEKKLVSTVYGEPSDDLIMGTIKGVDCVLLSRHGRGNTISPISVNYSANIMALKSEGYTHIVTTGCGSLQENIHPGDIVLIDQFIDWTQGRKQTFYDGPSCAPSGICLIPMSDPFCSKTRGVLEKCLKKLDLSHHTSGTMVTIEGPRFSSKAESKLWRSWGGHVVNMSTVPEVVLANEAGIPYASLALVTEYDSWREDTEAVTVDLAVKTFKENSERAIRLLLNAIPRLAEQDWTDTWTHCKAVAKSSVMPPPNEGKRE